MISKEKNVSYRSWKLSLLIVLFVSVGILFYKLKWMFICFGGGIISIILISFDVYLIKKSEFKSPIKGTILLYMIRYLIYIGYMLIMFLVFTQYEVIPAAIGLSIPRLCIIIYSLIKGGDAI